jgi:kynurenine formamidase
MKASVDILGNKYVVDLNNPLDISIPLRKGENNVNAFYIPPVEIAPFSIGSFIGDVLQGGSCNVNNIRFNPHGNGTHTECVGHIAKEKYTINQCMKTFFFLAEVVSVNPERRAEDLLITKTQLEEIFGNKEVEALVIRTLPNDVSKQVRQYSGSNPPYLESEAAAYLVTRGVKHLLLDVPSVDREDDGGKLSAHHAFWQYPHQPRTDCTITELIYVPDSIVDGTHLLNIQIASFENDASPSKPLLYRLQNG